MYERVIEIILFLVSEMRSDKQLSEVDVSVLTRKGYTQSEISTAFSWLFDRITVGEVIVSSENSVGTSHRVLHEVEKMVVSREAHGYLLQCHQLGIIDNQDIEAIIEKVMTAGFSSIGTEEIKTFIAGILFDIEDPDGNNSRISFDGSDTVH